MNDIPEMLCLREASKRTGLSYNHLRRLCLAGEIIYIKSGSKYLVNIPRLIEYLNRGGKKNWQKL